MDYALELLNLFQADKLHVDFHLHPLAASATVRDFYLVGPFYELSFGQAWIYDPTNHKVLQNDGLWKQSNQGPHARLLLYSTVTYDYFGLITYFIYDLYRQWFQGPSLGTSFRFNLAYSLESPGGPTFVVYAEWSPPLANHMDFSRLREVCDQLDVAEVMSS